MSRRLSRYGLAVVLVVLGAGVAPPARTEGSDEACGIPRATAGPAPRRPSFVVSALRADTLGANQPGFGPGPDPFPAGSAVEVGTSAPVTPPRKDFALAAGEVALLEVLPWAVNRYVSKSQFAYISIDTVRQNLETGFTYDRDSFSTDQSSHPFHGGLFFNAARSNGYSFWESGAFAFFGSFMWEAGMESEPPAINDLVNTTLGGMDRGEISHRLSTLLLDNTAHGASRFWRELGAAVLNPVGAFNRLIKGEMARTFENPPDRFPSRFIVDLEGFYRSPSGALANEDTSGQGGAEIRLRYGDPFDGERHRPYEFFDLALDMTYPATAFISRVESRGVLVDGPLGGDSKARQRIALMLHFNYYDNGPIAFGGQSFDLNHLVLLRLGGEAELRTEAGIAVAPMAALRVDYERLSTAVFGRSFDYGPAAAVQVSARIRRREIDLAKLSYSLLWQSTLDGVGKHSRVHSFSVEARAPIGRSLSAGAGWGWTERLTTYDAFPAVEKSGSAVKVFAAWTFR